MADGDVKMKVAVASGKGGTGKTFIATNLARIAAEQHRVTLFDLDVEEPNDHLFFSNIRLEAKPVEMMIPVVNHEVCDRCGICSQICEYHAIITLPVQVMVFPELCHSCYGCLELCPLQAISEGKKEIGKIHFGHQGNIELIGGTLKISEMATTALIRETKKFATDFGAVRIYDAPPGTSCPVIETAKDMDYVLLVGEPTPFGLHDLDLLVQVFRQVGKPFGVVVNKSVAGNTRVEDYCAENGIEILGHIPLRSDIAHTYASGMLAVEAIEGVRLLFEKLWETIAQKVSEAVR